MNDIKKRIEEIAFEAHEELENTGFFTTSISKLVALYHQLLLEERKRLIGVVNRQPQYHYGTDCIERQALLTTLNKEKD